MKSAQNWSDPSGITRTYTVDVTADANYSFDFNYTDLAGNELEVAVPTAYVTLDRVVPSGEITVNGLSTALMEIIMQHRNLGLSSLFLPSPSACLVKTALQLP